MAAKTSKPKATPSTPTAASVLAELERLGKPSAAKTYAKHGVKERSVGLTYADLPKLVKRLGTDHELAKALWKTSVHDARIVATKIADPEAATKALVEGWIRVASNYVIVDAISAFVARTTGALELALEWSRSQEEWRSAAGWNVIALLALDGKLDAKTARTLLAQIEKGTHAAPNRARHSMNGALIAIGSSLEGLRERALDVAKKLGTVRVDHGETGCKTPDAAAYIEKVAKRRARKK